MRESAESIPHALMTCFFLTRPLDVKADALPKRSNIRAMSEFSIFCAPRAMNIAYNYIRHKKRHNSKDADDEVGVWGTAGMPPVTLPPCAPPLSLAMPPVPFLSLPLVSSAPSLTLLTPAYSSSSSSPHTSSSCALSAFLWSRSSSPTPFPLLPPLLSTPPRRRHRRHHRSLLFCLSSFSYAPLSWGLG